MSKLYKDLKYDTDWVMQPGDPLTSPDGNTSVQAVNGGKATITMPGLAEPGASLSNDVTLADLIQLLDLPETSTLDDVRSVLGLSETATLYDASVAPITKALVTSPVKWEDVSNKPTSFAPAAHEHSAANITSGTLSVARGGTGVDGSVQAAHKVLASPSIGAAGAVSFRTLVASDIPDLNTSKLTAGTLGVARGGTGKSSHTINSVIVGGTSTTGALQNVAAASGAFYSTGANVKPQFGTLPVEQGGTGVNGSSQAINKVLASPASGSAGAISFRSLVAADIPTLSTSKISGLGDAATKNVGTASGTVAAGDHTHDAANISYDDNASYNTVAACLTDLVNTNLWVENNATNIMRGDETLTTLTLNGKPIATTGDTTVYATCSTASGTAAKVATVQGKTGFTLTQGATVCVKFTAASTDASPTLNIDSTGAKVIYCNGAAASMTNPFKWSANTLVTFVYDGTGWNAVGVPTHYYATCSTTASTQAKVVTVEGGTGFVMTSGTMVDIRFTTANTYAGAATLNVNGTGALTIRFNRAAINATNNPLFWTTGASLTFQLYPGSTSYWDVVDCERTEYANSSTAAATAAKTTTALSRGIALAQGSRVVVKFTNGNTVANPTLTLTGLNAYPICDSQGNALTASSLENWSDGEAVVFLFNYNSTKSAHQYQIENSYLTRKLDEVVDDLKYDINLLRIEDITITATTAATAIALDATKRLYKVNDSGNGGYFPTLTAPTDLPSDTIYVFELEWKTQSAVAIYTQTTNVEWITEPEIQQDGHIHTYCIAGRYDVSAQTFLLNCWRIVDNGTGE